MRRTASLDAIHLQKGPKEGALSLLLNKSTQTPDDWTPCCLADCGPQQELSSKKWSPPPTGGENFDKLIRQRLQRTNKEGIGLVATRFSPVHADHSVLAPNQAKSFACVQANGT